MHSFLQQSTSCGRCCESPLRVAGSPPGSVSPLCFPAGVPDTQQVSGCPSARNVETSGCTEEWTLYIWWSTAVFLPRTLILTSLKSSCGFLAGWDGGSMGWYYLPAPVIQKTPQVCHQCLTSVKKTRGTGIIRLQSPSRMLVTKIISKSLLQKAFLIFIFLGLF